MSELPPDIAVEPEPTDADPPPEAIRPDRPRIWPEEPRPPRPQIKRPMEEWLAEFENRIKQQQLTPRDQPMRRRRARGLARIMPAVAPQRQERARPAGLQPQSPDSGRRGRRRRRGGGRGQSQAQNPGVQTAGGGDAAGARPRPPAAPGRQRQGDRRFPRRDQRQKGEAGQQPPGESSAQPKAEGDAHRRRRRRGRGRGRGQPPAGGSPPNSSE